ncbi:MAG: DUF4416 family protein [Spirochaetaceae bacterium]|nr:DUF4416 family protein [Spirochaetaceae bacterium]
MGTSRSFENEILVMGVLLSRGEDFAPIGERLAGSFGPLELASKSEDFRWTDYYDEEMGAGILRFYLMFRDFVDPSRLSEIKQEANRIETAFSIGGKRRVNLDPGLLAPGRFVLATTKDRAHRIALSDGIFAELTLIYERGTFHALPWTYPDWASEPVRTMLSQWRKRLFLSKAE